MENEQALPEIETLLEDVKEGYGDKTDLAVNKLSQNATFGTIRRLISKLAEPAFVSISPKLKLNDIFALIGEKAVSDLIEAMYSPDETLSLRAVEVLHKVNTRASVSAFIEFVEKAPLSSPARSEAIRCLGRIGDSKAVPVLTAAFNRSVAAVEAREWSKIDPFIWSVAYSLVGLGKDCYNTIYQALASSHYRVRRWAWDSLKYLQRGFWSNKAFSNWIKESSDLVNSLVPLLKSPYWRERFNIAWLLMWSIGPADDIDEALFPLLSDPSTSVRYLAVQISGPTRERVKLKFLEMLGSEPQPMVRQVLLRSLGQVADNQVWPTVLQAIQEEDELVRADAIAAAVKLSDSGVIPTEEKIRLVNLLIGTIADSRLHVRRATFLALGHFTSDARVISIFREELLVKGSKDAAALTQDYLLYNILNGLGSSSDAAGFDILVEALKHSNSRIRAAAAERLGNLPAVPDYLPAIEALIARFKDTEEDYGVRQKAATSLGALKTPLGLSALLQGLTTDDAQLIAAEALGDFGATEAVPLLLKLLEANPSSEIIDTCARALGKLEDSRAVLPLSSLLETVDARNTKDLSVALGQLHDNRAVPALIKALKNSSRYSRKHVAEALGKIIDPGDQAVEALCMALNDEETDVRLAAAQALGEIGSPKARPALEWAVNHGLGYSWDPGANNSLAQKARMALAKLRDSSGE